MQGLQYIEIVAKIQDASATLVPKLFKNTFPGVL